MAIPAAASRISLCLWLPTFELRLELVRFPELDATSVALLAPGTPGARGRIWQVSERAAEAGIRPGMPVSRALSLCSDLTLLEPDPDHYGVAAREILEVLEGISPVVQPAAQTWVSGARNAASFAERGIFHVGMDGMERLYGPPRAQVDRTLHALLEVLPRPLVAALRVGRAPGLFGARVAAASSRPGLPVLVEEAELAAFLAPCPVSILPLSEELLERLGRLEIRTLGALGELPLPALLRHFGRVGEVARALARGERIDPVRPLHRPRPIRASLDLPSPSGERERIHRGFERLLERALARPERRGRSVRGVRVGGHLEDGGSWEVEVTLREPSARVEELAFPLRARIERTPPPRAVETLFVEFFDFGAPVVQDDLFPPHEVGARHVGRGEVEAGRISLALEEAVRELTLKLGHSPLYRVVEVDPWSRIPERRHALLPIEP